MAKVTHRAVRIRRGVGATRGTSPSPVALAPVRGITSIFP